jgi:N-formylmaleamate deformylase
VEEAPVAWQEHDVVVDGRRLHLRRGGTGQAVVCLHGVGDDGTCFEVIARDLAGDHEVVLPDARGHGRSDPAGRDGDYRAAAQADDLAGLVRELGLERPVLLGHSMGALTALVAATRHPSLPAALVLEDPPPHWLDPPDDEDDDTGARRAAMLDLKRRTFDELVADQREAQPTWPDGEIERWARAKQRFHPDVVAIFGARSEPADRLRAAAATITCPVLLLRGDPDRGALVTADAAAILGDHVPDLEVVHLPGTGHSIRHDDPAGYGAAVRALLGRLAHG